MRNLTRALFALTLTTAPATAQAPSAPPDTALRRIMLAHRLALRLENGRVVGAGAEFLAGEGKRAQFFLVGEEHGVAETPQVIGGLLRELRPAGYTHFAIEVSPLSADRFNALRGKPTPRNALDSMFTSWLDAAPFYTMRTEADLLGQALAPDRASAPMQILGLDYDVMGDRYWLRRLESLTPVPRRAAVTRARVLADSGFAAVATRGDPTKMFAWSAPDSVFAALREAVRPTPGSESAKIIDVFERTARINRAFLAGQGYASNRERGEFMRENLLAGLGGSRPGAAMPRTVFKFGYAHMMRGFTPSRIIDLGSAADVLASTQGRRAFSLLILGGAEAKHAQMDITKLEYLPATGSALKGGDLAWIAAAVPDSGWVVFDLAAVRTEYLDRRVRNLTPAQERMLLAFDAVAVLTGSGPNEGMVLRKQ